MTKFWSTLLVLWLTACGTTSSPTDKPRHLGLLEVSFTGLGTQQLNAKVRNLGQSTRAISDLGDGIQLELFARTTFDFGTRGADGVRYLSATFRVRNASSNGTPYNSERQNLSFVAVSTPNTIQESAIRSLEKFDGSPANPALALQIMPTHGMALSQNGALVQPTLEDFQAFSENDLASLGVIAGVDAVLPYGFVTRCVSHCKPNARNLAANSASGQFDGLVTFAMRLPLQANPKDDPFKISMLVEVVDDSNTRVTQSLEEQSQNHLAFTRATALSNAPVTVLPGGLSPNLCSVRTAGSAATPGVFLSKGFERVGTPSLSNQMFVAPHDIITADFGAVMDDPTPEGFVVQGFMTGRKHGVFSGATTTRLSFIPDLQSFFPAGELLEVTLTGRLSSLNGLHLCPSYTFQYRTAVTTASAASFKPAVNVSPDTFPDSVATADVNNDGKLDAITANLGSNNVSVLLGNGDGSFKPTKNVAVGSLPRGLAVGDANNDGKMDAFSVNENAVSVLLGNGDGSFKAATNIGVDSLAFSLVTGDINNDGNLDVLTGNIGVGSVSVLLGNGDGSFQAVRNQLLNDRPIAVALGDANNDGKLDLFTASTETFTVAVLLGNGNGSFQTASTYPVGNTPTAVTVADLNGDGTIDLLCANAFSDSVSVLLGNGDGSFQAAHDFATNIVPSSVAVADLNGDQRLDVFTVNQRSNSMSVLLGEGNGSFKPAVNLLVGARPLRAAAGDLNGDGKLDLLSANHDSSNVSVLLQR
jgi:FG-GAP-like repeat